MLPLRLLCWQESKRSGTTSHIIFVPGCLLSFVPPPHSWERRKGGLEIKRLVLAYFFLYETCPKQSFPVKQTGSLLVAGFSCKRCLFFSFCWQHKCIFGVRGVTIVEIYFSPCTVMLICGVVSQALPCSLVLWYFCIC